MPSIGPAFGTGVNEHFKPFFNDGLATVVVMLRSQLGFNVRAVDFCAWIISPVPLVNQLRRTVVLFNEIDREK